MTNKTTTTKFNVSDIVTIASDYKEFAKLDIAQPQIQVYTVMSVNADETLSLAGVFSDIPTEFIEGVPMESELAKQIYYDTNHARPYEPSKVYQKEDVYSRPPFTTTIEERCSNTPMWEKMQIEEFHYVHELQHWFVEHDGYSRILVNQFWGMRKPLKI